MHKRPNLRFSIPEREKMHGSFLGILAANQTCIKLAFPVLLYICSPRYYRQKWLLEGHVAPPPKSQFRRVKTNIHMYKRFHRCVIWEMCHWKTPPDRHLNFLPFLIRDANPCIDCQPHKGCVPDLQWMHVSIHLTHSFAKFSAFFIGDLILYSRVWEWPKFEANFWKECVKVRGKKWKPSVPPKSYS